MSPDGGKAQERGLALKPDVCEERGGGGFLIVPLKDILTPTLRSSYGGDYGGARFRRGPCIHCEPSKGARGKEARKEATDSWGEAIY